MSVVGNSANRQGLPVEGFAFEHVSYAARGRMEWDDSAQAVVDSLSAALDTDNPLEHDFWGGARLVRAIIDNATDPDRASLISDAMEFNMGLYAGNPDRERFERVVRAVQRCGLLGFRVQQEFDITTFQNTFPEGARWASQDLVARTSGPLLVIPVCHGGLVSTIEMGLYARAERPDVRMHPVRFSKSVNKPYRDKRPFISGQENVELRYAARGREVVVADEDAVSGDTLAEAVRHFRAQLPDAQNVTGQVVKDARNTLDRQRQGRYWEK